MSRREAVLNIFMMLFGKAWPGADTTTYAREADTFNDKSMNDKPNGPQRPPKPAELVYRLVPLMHLADRYLAISIDLSIVYVR